jgi:hypothetical protein
MHNITLIIGIALLALGRKLFWLFVGAVGFLIGMQFASAYLQGYGENIVLITGLIGGVIGIVLAILVQKVAVLVGGFVGGGYLAMNIVESAIHQPSGQSVWIAFLIGGILGAILVSTLFEWALILLSSLVGALLIVQSLDLGPQAESMAFLVLAAGGIVVQAWMKRKPRPVSE